MARVVIRRSDEVDFSATAAGVVETRAYFAAPEDPILVHVHRLLDDGRLSFEPGPCDRSVYVWAGEVAAGEVSLQGGSSVIIERGGSLQLRGVEDDSLIVVFAAQKPAAPKGGHVHLLPHERVPRTENLAGATGVAGALHADGACPTCSVWLHENRMQPPIDPDAGGGVHAHTEDEVIFVTSGQLRFGDQLCGPGSALAIPADAFYSFGVGFEGLSFINFRGGRPGLVRFKGGGNVDEASYWAELGSPRYLAPDPAMPSAHVN